MQGLSSAVYILSQVTLVPHSPLPSSLWYKVSYNSRSDDVQKLTPRIGQHSMRSVRESVSSPPRQSLLSKHFLSMVIPKTDVVNPNEQMASINLDSVKCILSLSEW